MSVIDIKSIFTPEFIARIIISVFVGSVTLWIVGDRLLTHALGGDRARVDNLTDQVRELNGSVREHEVLVAKLDTLLKTLELNDRSKARQLVIEVLGKSYVDEKKVEEILQIFEPYFDPETLDDIEKQNGDALLSPNTSFFEVLTIPQETNVSDKVEVIEYLWLGCPHCYDLQPTLNQWEKTMPDYVHFVREAPPLNESWENQSRGLYAARLLNKEDEFVKAMFEMIHEKNQPMRTKENISKLAGSLGMNTEFFLNTMDSHTVNNMVKAALDMAMSSELTAVPTLIVNGKYRVSFSISGGYEGILRALNELIKIEKDEMKLQ